ncbi:hypothetical protein [Dictyobacter formicarum]|uniref:hypothetical protein n=1 Tax=Dictyobacter formicarum TaxID=2778368 RepID=UPI00191645A7|nr:hypothetical protein [Dictyobacter formicarum]
MPLFVIIVGIVLGCLLVLWFVWLLIRRIKTKHSTYFVGHNMLWQFYGIDFPDGRTATIRVDADRSVSRLEIFDTDEARRQAEDELAPLVMASRDRASGRIDVEACTIPREQTKSYLHYLLIHNHHERWIPDISTYLAVFK